MDTETPLRERSESLALRYVMRQSSWDRLTLRDMAREACFLNGQEPDEAVAGTIVDAAGR